MAGRVASKSRYFVHNPVSEHRRYGRGAPPAAYSRLANGTFMIMP